MLNDNEKLEIAKSIETSLLNKDYAVAYAGAVELIEEENLTLHEKELIAKSFQNYAFTINDKGIEDYLQGMAHKLYLDIIKEDRTNKAANETLAFSFFFGDSSADIDEVSAKPCLEVLLDYKFEYALLPLYYLLQKSNPNDYSSWIDFLLQAKDYEAKEVYMSVLEHLKLLEKHMSVEQRQEFFAFMAAKEYSFNGVEHLNSIKTRLRFVALRLPVTEENINLLKDELKLSRSVFIKNEIAGYLTRAYLSPNFYNENLAILYASLNLEDYAGLVSHLSGFKNIAIGLELVNSLDEEEKLKGFEIFSKEVESGNIFASNVASVQLLNKLIESYKQVPGLKVEVDLFEEFISRYFSTMKYGCVSGISTVVLACLFIEKADLALEVIRQCRLLSCKAFTPELESELYLLESDVFRSVGMWDSAQKYLNRAKKFNPENPYLEAREKLIEEGRLKWQVEEQAYKE